MPSPIATGGARIHLESWIAAEYLAETLPAERSVGCRPARLQRR
jgi:hypothetical protein